MGGHPGNTTALHFPTSVYRPYQTTKGHCTPCALAVRRARVVWLRGRRDAIAAMRAACLAFRTLPL